MIGRVGHGHGTLGGGQGHGVLAVADAANVLGKLS